MEQPALQQQGLSKEKPCKILRLKRKYIAGMHTSDYQSKDRGAILTPKEVEMLEGRIQYS